MTPVFLALPLISDPTFGVRRYLAVAGVAVLLVQVSFGQGFAPTDAAGRMTVAEGLRATLFASEPEVRQPIFCKCDDRGRLWTIQYLQYPNPAGLTRVSVDRFSRTVYDRKPEPPPHGPRGADRITILEDTDGDGRADQFRDFVTGLNLCTGVEFGFGGVFVIQAPYLLFYPDHNRDDVPDADPEVLLDGFGLEDAQSLANHLTWGPDGWLYGLNGSTTTCRIRGIEFQQGVWRYHPITREFELFCEGGGNIYGLTFDRQGRLLYSSNGGVFYHGVQGGYYEKNFGKHGPLHNPFTYGYFSHVRLEGSTGRPNPGATMYLGDSFPRRYHDTLMVSDFLTHTCSWWQVEPAGSTVTAKLGGLLLNSHDTWFGATDLCLGPDGAVYVADFCDQRTAHPDPDAQWDTSNGRIYRIQGDPPASPHTGVPDFSSRSTAALIELLQSPNGWIVQRARRFLAERQDPTAWVPLRDLAVDSSDPELSLQALWALHSAGGLDAPTAVQLLDHKSEHVRSWTVRLLGDTGHVTPELITSLLKMAEHDASVIVRGQLAATSRRLAGDPAVSILHTLISRGVDAQDAFVPLQLWWGLEAKAISDRDRILTLFAKSECWDQPAFRDHLLRLLRRYAADGTPPAFAACQGLWDSAPQHAQEPVLQALHQGLSERSAAASREPLPPELQQKILAAWQNQPDQNLRLRLGLQAGLSEPYGHLLDQLRLSESVQPLDADAIVQRLSVLAEYGRDDCVPVVLRLAGEELPESVRTAALGALQRFASPEIAATILRAYPNMSAALRSRSRDVLFRRPGSTLSFLALVEQNLVDPKEVPVDQLRPLALFQNSEVDVLVRKYWGNIQPGTPEEKLADVRRFSNDLRAGSGDPVAGRQIYQKQCGICHKLHGEGTPVGPDLTGTVRGDQASLLTSIVAPSSVVRLEYLSYVVVTTSGAVHTGIIAEQDAAVITLLDAKNQRTRISRDQIDEMTESTVSLMPERLLEQLTPQQLRDLFAWLQSSPPPTP